MKVSVVARVKIDAKPAKIFEYLTNLQHHQLWNPHLQSIAPLITLTKPGMSYKTSSLLLGVKVQSINVVTRLISGQELELQNDTGTLHYRVNYQLEADEVCTLVRCTTSVSSSSDAFAFTGPVLKLLAKRELQSDLRALKIAVEQNLE